MRTLFLASALLLFPTACGDDKKADQPEPTATEPAPRQAQPTPAPTGEVKRMSPSEVKKEVDRAGKEHTDKVDKALDM